MIKKLEKAIWLSLFLPYFAQAQGSRGNPDAIIPNRSVFGSILPGNPNDTFGGFLSYLIMLVLGLAGLIAVTMIIWSGFRYITARGDDKVVGDAKKTLLNAIIGLVIIILSYTIVAIVSNAAFGRVR